MYLVFHTHEKQERIALGRTFEHNIPLKREGGKPRSTLINNFDEHKVCIPVSRVGKKSDFHVMSQSPIIFTDTQLVELVGDAKLNLSQARPVDWIHAFYAGSDNLTQRYWLILFYISTTESKWWLSCHSPTAQEGDNCTYTKMISGGTLARYAASTLLKNTMPRFVIVEQVCTHTRHETKIQRVRNSMRPCCMTTLMFLRDLDS